MEEFYSLVGPLSVPLALCLGLSLLIICERIFVIARAGMVDGKTVREVISRAAEGDLEGMQKAMLPAQAPFREGAQVLLENLSRNREIREEAAAIWLEGYRNRLTSGLGLLSLIATIAPMLGLLGTVIGMVFAFKEIAGHTGPIGPALLADGLWQAMLTTVLGLVIALPALVAGSAFQALAEARVARVAACLTRLSHAMESIDPQANRLGVAA